MSGEDGCAPLDDEEYWASQPRPFDLLVERDRLLSERDAAVQAAANAVEALRAERQRRANVLHYLRNVPVTTPLAEVYREVSALINGEPEPGR